MQIRNLIVAIAVMAVIGFVSEQSMAQGPNNLFAQYYTQGGASQAHAAMYPAPHPVPSHVGGAYYTYQPLMPHEHMYAHRRDYYTYHATPDSFYCEGCRGPGSRYNPGYGYTKTSVRWQSSCNSVMPLPGTLMPFQQLQRVLNHKKSVPRPLHTCWGGCDLKGKLGLNGSCLGGGCLGKHGGGCLGGTCPGGYGGDYGYDSYGDEYYGDGGCSDGGCATNWNAASQAAAARTAAAMQNRYAR